MITKALNFTRTRISAISIVCSLLFAAGVGWRIARKQRWAFRALLDSRPVSFDVASLGTFVSSPGVAGKWAVETELSRRTSDRYREIIADRLKRHERPIYFTRFSSFNRN